MEFRWVSADFFHSVGRIPAMQGHAARILLARAPEDAIGLETKRG